MNSRRRDFILSSLVFGSVALFSTESLALPSDATDKLADVQDVAPGEALVLYTGLLDDIRREVLLTNLSEIERYREDAVEQYQTLFGEAKRLNTKYKNRPSSADAGEAADFYALLDSITSSTIGTQLDRIYLGKISIREFESKISSIRAAMLAACGALLEAGSLDKSPQQRTAKITDAYVNIDGAVASLDSLSVLGRPGGELSSLERLKLMLQGVRKTVPYLSATMPSATHGHEGASLFLAADEREVSLAAFSGYTGLHALLRRYVKPGTPLQIGIGWVVTVPILVGNTETRVRKRLLEDALRLVPGFGPPDLSVAADKIAVFVPG